MWEKKKLCLAISTAIASTSAGFANAEIEEIIVTATKRAQSTQDVPVTVQAVGGDTVKDLRIETFDKYVEYLPNVVGAGNGPGKKELYIRGSATEQSSVTVSACQGSAPGVALYVDEQPVSFGGRNLDVYSVDMERIEVLSGPQGTLFGASSQSGNLRLITKKPVQGEFEAGFNTRFSATDGGTGSGAMDAYVNIPVSDSVAARVTVYSDTQGGWIDNIPATFTPSAEVTDRNDFTHYAPPMASADSVQSATNETIVQNNWNEANYRGVRAGLVFEINEDWDVLLQHTAQTLESEGTFLVDTSLDQNVASALFSPDFNRDEFGLTTWTLNGRIANLDLIYTGGFLDRDVESIIDYTHYNNGGGYISYYLCSGNLYDASDVNNCFDPTKQYDEVTTNQRTTHEFRVTSDQTRRIRVLGGLYLNDVETSHIGEFKYQSTNNTFAEHTNSYYNDNRGDGFLLGNTTIPTAGVNATGPRGPLTTFFNDYTRKAEEVAVFGEVAFDLSDVIKVSVSARYYDLTSQLQGASNFSFGCRYGIGGFGLSEFTADGRCNSHVFSNDVTARLETLGRYNQTGDDNIILGAHNPTGSRDMFRGGGSNQATLDAIKNGHLSLKGLDSDGSINETDTIIKAAVDWRPNENVLLYLTWSEGYRPATLNRNAGQLSANQEGIYQNYVVPAVALTDKLTSFELGMKGDFFYALRLNAALYRSNIKDLQVSRFDPSNVAFLYFIENVGDAKITGLEADFQWAVSDALTVSGAFSILGTELTRINSQLQGISVPVGSDLPLAPSFAGNLRARYEVPLASLDARVYVLGSLNYRGKSVSGIVGSAELMDDTLFRQSGNYSGLEIQNEGGNFGTVEIPDGADGRRLSRNSRFVNPASTTINAAVGLETESWSVELFLDNLNDEKGQVMQIAGHYTPVVTMQRPRSFGIRMSYDF